MITYDRETELQNAYMTNYDRETILNIEKALDGWRLDLIWKIMDNEFEDFLWEYWYLIKDIEDPCEFLDLYAHRQNSPYYRDKPEEKN